MKINLLLVDDHKIVREGLKNLLHNKPDFAVVGEAVNGRDAIGKNIDLKPDIVLMDVTMPDLNGMEATRRIKKDSPETRVIALSMHTDKQFIIGMFKAGASGYLLKDCAVDELVDAIRLVNGNHIYISKQISGIVIGELLELSRASETETDGNLSDREIEVLQLIAEGKTTRDVAEILIISIKTVESHRQNIMNKLKLFTLPELTKYAIRMGFTTLDK